MEYFYTKYYIVATTIKNHTLNGWITHLVESVRWHSMLNNLCRSFSVECVSYSGMMWCELSWMTQMCPHYSSPPSTTVCTNSNTNRWCQRNYRKSAIKNENDKDEGIKMEFFFPSYTSIAVHVCKCMLCRMRRVLTSILLALWQPDSLMPTL